MILVFLKSTGGEWLTGTKGGVEKKKNVVNMKYSH